MEICKECNTNPRYSEILKRYFCECNSFDKPYHPECSKREYHLIYRPDKYDGPTALNATPSEECKEYHKNSYIQINVDGKNMLEKCDTSKKRE